MIKREQVKDAIIKRFDITGYKYNENDNCFYRDSSQLKAGDWSNIHIMNMLYVKASNFCSTPKYDEYVESELNEIQLIIDQNFVDSFLGKKLDLYEVFFEQIED